MKALNIGETTEDEQKMIKRYPFNGRSNYLIDKFYTIGFDYLSLNKLLFEYLNFDEQATPDEKPKRFTFGQNPSIINEISSDYSKECLPQDQIIDIIFPNEICFYYVVESNESKSFKNEINNGFNQMDFIYNNKDIKNFKVVFSSNPQAENNTKKSINGFSYVFYKRLLKKRKMSKITYTFYIPIAFCIISEFPYFSGFYQLCQKIEKLYHHGIYNIPLEIIIYNIINFTPSPLNADIYLLNDSMEDLDTLKSGSFSKINQNNNKNQRYTLFESNLNNDFELVDSTGNTLRVSIKPEPKSDYIIFNQLSGYPLIQYNLCKVLLNKMSPIDVIKIFIYTFLEKDIIFFSSDLEYLSLSINSYLNLNFPLNDEKYYFINATVSFENYVNGNSPFVGTAFTSIVGINDQYQEKYKNTVNKLNDHLAVDLDKGKIYIESENKNSESYKRNKSILEVINFATSEKEKEKFNEVKLYKETKNLFQFLNNIKEKNPSLYQKKIINGNYLDYGNISTKMILNNSVNENNYIAKTN